MWKIAVAGLATLLALASAQAEVRCVRGTDAGNGKRQFALKSGQSICLNGKRETVTFRRPRFDYRCPDTVRCTDVGMPLYGPLFVDVSIKHRNGKAQTKTLDLYRPLKFAGAHFQLVELTPHPSVQGQRFPRSEYTVFIEVDHRNNVTSRACYAELCIQVVVCGKMQDGTWRLFGTPCDAQCAGAVELSYDLELCSAGN
jgi:hypothetical protein